MRRVMRQFAESVRVMTSHAKVSLPLFVLGNLQGADHGLVGAYLVEPHDARGLETRSVRRQAYRAARPQRLGRWGAGELVPAPLSH